MTDKIKILIVDDDPLMRRALTTYIHQHEDLTVIGEAEDTNTALHVLSESNPDIALVDILGFEEDEGGIGIIRKIKLQCKELPILAMSSHEESLYANTALDAGARGYLMKQEAAEKIGKVIRQIINGGIYVSGKTGAKIIQQHMKNSSDQLELNF